MLFFTAEDQYFTGDDRAFPGGYGLLKEGVVNKTILENNLMQMDKDYLPDIPIFVYHGALDSIVQSVTSMSLIKLV